MAAFSGSDEKGAVEHVTWQTFNTAPYVSATHGGRYVNNAANAVAAAAYGRYEDVGKAPAGSLLAKNSFVVMPNGKVAIGPLFTMTKMDAGWYAESGDWRYAMVMPDGSTWGVTKGKNSKGMQFCIDCHSAVGDDQDHLFFLPEEYRK